MAYIPTMPLSARFKVEGLLRPSAVMLYNRKISIGIQRQEEKVIEIDNKHIHTYYLLGCKVFEMK